MHADGTNGGADVMLIYDDSDSAYTTAPPMRPSEACCLTFGCSHPKACDEIGMPCGWPGTVAEWRERTGVKEQQRGDVVSNIYKITIERWPYFGVAQEAAGPREQTFPVRADSMRHAVELADQFAHAIVVSPQVHQAVITGIVLARPLQ